MGVAVGVGVGVWVCAHVRTLSIPPLLDHALGRACVSHKHTHIQQDVMFCGVLHCLSLCHSWPTHDKDNALHTDLE